MPDSKTSYQHLRRSGRLGGRHPDDVAHREHPDHFGPLADDEMAEAPGDHRRGGLVEAPVRSGDDDVAGQMRLDALRVDVLPAADRVEDVAFGEDAGLVLVAVHDDRGADLAAGHQGCGLAQRVMRTDREDVGAHRVTDQHAGLPVEVTPSACHSATSSFQDLYRSSRPVVTWP